MKMVERKVTSVADMHLLAADIGRSLRGGELLLLEGELGSGKTTFVQGLGKFLGVEQALTSPTFTIVAEYDTGHPVIRRLVHADLYRLDSAQAPSDPAVQHLLHEAQNSARVTVVEWGDRLETLPAGLTSWHIQFAHGTAPSERQVRYPERNAYA